MPKVDVANNFYTFLALFADAVVVFALLLAVAALFSKRARGVAGGIAASVAPAANWLGFVVALVATTGSLYYSEHAGFIPCQLCWYQRIIMYPLVIVLGVAALRKDKRAWMTVLPFVVLGAGVSTYHWLVERVPAFAETSSCGLEAPCTAPWFEKLGFITLAWMALSGFLLIGTLMVCQIVGNRVAATPDATDDDSDERDERDEREMETVS